jgi:hypothetical protein
VQGIQITATAHTTAVVGINEKGHLTLFVAGGLKVRNGKDVGLGTDNVTIEMAAADLESGDYDARGGKWTATFRADGNLKTGTGNLKECLLATLACHNEAIRPPQTPTPSEKPKASDDTAGSGGGGS